MLVFEWIKDLLFPKYCLGCGQYGLYLCQKCQQKQTFVDILRCCRCQKQAFEGQTHAACYARFGLAGIVSLYQNKGKLKELLKVLKYKGWFDMMPELNLLAEHAWNNIKTNISFTAFCQQKPLVLAVPLHQKRQRERGFNQSEILANIFAHKLGLEIVSNLLIRQQPTPYQAKLSRSERFVNIRQAFVLNPNTPAKFLTRHQILLVDDIWTTGATLKECAKTLKKGGVKEVWALTMAY